MKSRLRGTSTSTSTSRMTPSGPASRTIFFSVLRMFKMGYRGCDVL